MQPSPEQLFLACSLLRTRLTRLVPIPEILRTLACAGLGLAVAWFANVPSFGKAFGLGLHALVFSAVFFAAGLACGLFTSQDRALARRWAARLVPAWRSHGAA